MQIIIWFELMIFFLWFYDCSVFLVICYILILRLTIKIFNPLVNINTVHSLCRIEMSFNVKLCLYDEYSLGSFKMLFVNISNIGSFLKMSSILEIYTMSAAFFQYYSND